MQGLTLEEASRLAESFREVMHSDDGVLPDETTAKISRIGPVELVADVVGLDPDEKALARAAHKAARASVSVTSVPCARRRCSERGCM